MPLSDAGLLFIGAFFAAAISGAAGFGGALLLLPLLVSTVGAVHAVPLLTIAQLVGNVSRAGFGFAQIRWKPVGLFLAGAIPFSLAGALSFVQLPHDWIMRAIGAAILLFVVLKYAGVVNLAGHPALLATGGGVTGFLSGLVGSAGPLGAAIFLSLGLPPVAYIASEAITALAMHGVKTLVYQHYITLDREFWLLAVLMGMAMVLGTWSARRAIERLSQSIFRGFVSALLIAIALYMMIHG